MRSVVKLNVGKVHSRTFNEGPEAEIEVKLYSFFNLGARSGSTPRPESFTPGKRSGTHCIGGCVGPRDGLDCCGKSGPPPGFDT